MLEQKQSGVLLVSLKILGVGVLYFLLGKFAFAISVSNGIVTNAPFFAEGVGLAATILLGYFSAIGIFVGQFVLAVTSGVDLFSSSVIASINSLLAILGCFLFSRFRFSENITSFKNILLLSILILLLLQPLSALLGNFTLFRFGRIDRDIFWISSITWWLGNSIGQLIFVPLMLFLFTQKNKIEKLLLKDIVIAFAAFMITFLLFKLTYYLDNSYTLLALFFLFPITLIFSTLGRPRMVLLSLLAMTIAAFVAISINVANLSVERIDTFMRLDLLIISLQLSGLMLTVLIDERKKTMDALKRSEDQLREINATKDKFFSIIAHDLKNSFTSILGYSELLKEYATKCSVKETENYAVIINSSAQQAFQLLENLLDWARVQQGRINFSPQNANLFDISNKVIDLLKDNADQKGITINNEISSNTYVFVDEDMIKTVMRNLISNAIKFTQPGGSIEIRASKTHDEIQVSVVDNGIGIGNGNIEKLFDYNSNFSTQGTRNEKGTGLGLSLCREFIEKHGSKIWVKSELGRGSEFVFSLPLKH